MQNRFDHQEQDTSNDDLQPPSFWRSRAGIYLFVALVLAGLLLGYEHRNHIFSSGWLIWLPLLICIGMHFFMHGRHGGRNSEGGRS